MESTLQAQYRDLTGDVGHFLGFGRGVAFGDAVWTARQQANLDRCVKGGLRNFYHCGYEWSFLKPFASLTLAEGETVVRLPDDFGSATGRILLSSDDSTSWSIELGPVGRVYEWAARQVETTGTPIMVCQEPIKGTAATEGQRFQLRFYPISDRDYTVQLQYNLNPDYLSGSMPYAYGGAQHAETILSSCKAVAERDFDDMADGPQQLEFMRRLQVSMELDKRQKPQSLGYNADRTEWRSAGRRGYGWPQAITYEGQTP